MVEERKSEEEGEWKRVEMSEQVAMVFGWTEDLCLFMVNGWISFGSGLVLAVCVKELRLNNNLSLFG